MIRAKILLYISTGPPRLWAFLPISYTYHSSSVIIIKVFPWIILALQPRLTLQTLSALLTIGLIERIDEYQDADETILMLSTLFSTKLDPEEIKRRMENIFHFKMSRELEERSALMCNLSSIVFEEGIEKGIEQGIQQEKENSLFRSAKLSRRYGVSMEVALAYLKAEKEWEDSEVDRVVQIVYNG